MTNYKLRKIHKLMLKNPLGKGLLALALILGTTGIGFSVVSADTTTDTKPKFMSSIVTAISQKFGLSETEVQAVFDVEMQKHKTEMEAKFTAGFATRLATAVTEGKITQAQADLIKAKQVEVKAQMEALREDKTETGREKMKALMVEVKTWAEANNIPKEYLMLGGHGGKGGRGFGKLK